MADDTGAPHEIPFLEAADQPSLHGITSLMAAQIATRLGFVGKSVIATSESRSNSSYGLLSTPDRVQNVVLPTDGWLQIGYHATWEESNAAAGEAAIFIGSNQLKIASSTATAPIVQSAITNQAAAAKETVLSTHTGGLVSIDVGDLPGNPDYGGDVTTGQVLGVHTSTDSLGGPVIVFAAAGTYTVSVQFKASTGSVTVKNRRLWVRALPF